MTIPVDINSDSPPPSTADGTNGGHKFQSFGLNQNGKKKLVLHIISAARFCILYCIMYNNIVTLVNKNKNKKTRFYLKSI